MCQAVCQVLLFSCMPHAVQVGVLVWSGDAGASLPSLSVQQSLVQLR